MVDRLDWNAKSVYVVTYVDSTDHTPHVVWLKFKVCVTPKAADTSELKQKQMQVVSAVLRGREVFAVLPTCTERHCYAVIPAAFDAFSRGSSRSVVIVIASWGLALQRSSSPRRISRMTLTYNATDTQGRVDRTPSRRTALELDPTLAVVLGTARLNTKREKSTPPGSFSARSESP